MKTARIIGAVVLACVSVCISTAQELVINEIMYAPLPGKSEWIELYNPGKDRVNIRDWIIHDATTARPVLTSDSLTVGPDDYLVLAENGSLLQEFPNIASKLLVVSRLPALNNGGDDLALLRRDSSIVDRVSYTSAWGGGAGVSLERIDAKAASNSSGNWMSSEAVQGATPSLRNSVALPEFDLEIAELSYVPEFPEIGEYVDIQVLLRNAGSVVLTEYSFLLYEDLDKDGQPGNGEEVYSEQIAGPTPSGGTYNVSARLPPSLRTERIVLYEAVLNGDEKPANNNRADTLYYALLPGSVVINEIMYAPEGGEPEWIELRNNTSAEIRLRDWEIGDRSARRDIESHDAVIEPSGYLVLSASEEILTFHDSIPEPLLVLPLPSFNNGGDEVILRNERGSKMDSVQYQSDWGSGGFSLERKDALESSTDRHNWFVSVDSERSTPGRENSTAVRQYDLAVIAVSGDQHGITVRIRNEGKKKASSAVLVLYRDDDRDSIATAQEEIQRLNVGELEYRDSLEIRYDRIEQDPGIAQFIVVLLYPEDQRVSNNSLTYRYAGPFGTGHIALNEIMFDPADGGAEWLEFLNKTTAELNVEGFLLAGRTDSHGDRTVIRLPDRHLAVSPGGYLLLSSDSSILEQYPNLAAADSGWNLVILNRSSLSLRNSSEEVVFIDPSGQSIDSVTYREDWHNSRFISTRGFSLERLNPDFDGVLGTHWSTSVDPSGGTPGRRNSLYTTVPPPSATGNIGLDLHPNPFSPDSDGFEDFCVMTYSLPASVSQIRLRVFDTRGRMLRTIANNAPSGENGRIVWDGLDDAGQRLSIGMYILLLEATGSRNETVAAVKRVVVVAARL